VHVELTTSLQHLHDQTGFPNPVPAPLLAFIALALSQGLLLYSMMDSKTYTEEMVSRSSEVTFDRMLMPL
jgi:uncharacterized membrane protein